MHVRTHTHVHARMHACTCVCAHTHTNMQACTHTCRPWPQHRTPVHPECPGCAVPPAVPTGCWPQSVPAPRSLVLWPPWPQRLVWQVAHSPPAQWSHRSLPEEQDTQVCTYLLHGPFLPLEYARVCPQQRLSQLSTFTTSTAAVFIHQTRDRQVSVQGNSTQTT